MTRTLGGRYEQYTGTEGLADDWSPEGASASPARRSCANGRFVDARYLLSRWAWFTRLLRLRPSEGNNRLAASDADCSNAAFFGTHPFAPQFSSSHALIWLSGEPNPSCGTPVRMRTRKCRSGSAIHEARIRSHVSSLPGPKPLEAHRTDWRWLEG
jgi:hypothetical protein